MSEPIARPTSAARRNILFLISDQHAPGMTGYAGHPDVLTPNIDRLAAQGTTFDSAYCTSPICVPARASMATGRYVHELGNWDNAAPYTGATPSWGRVRPAPTAAPEPGGCVEPSLGQARTSVDLPPDRACRTAIV